MVAAWPQVQHVEGIELRSSTRWWGQQYAITGMSDFPIPERMILYVSERGMDHGYWRDLRVGDRAFDARFFVFSDSPALLPIVCGESTRSALTDTGPNRDDIVLYVREGRVKTTSHAHHLDTAAIARHVAVHRGLADDHRAFLARWKQRMDDAAGRADAVWPPAATLLRPSGALVVTLAWSTPVDRDSDWDEAARSMRTEITAHDDRERIQWTLREVSETTPCTHVLANRRYKLTGTLPIQRAQLEHIIRQGQVSSIRVHANRITVGMHDIASSTQIEAAVRVIHLVVDATAETSSPYR